MDGRTIALAAAFAALSSPGAADWRVSGFFSERLTLEDNPDREADGGDAAAFSVTDLGLSFAAETPRGSVIFAPGVRGFVSVGDDEDPTLLPRLSSSADIRGRRGTLAASLNVTPDFVRDAQFEDSGATSANALQVDVSGAVNGSLLLDPRHSLTAGLLARGRIFTEDTVNLSNNTTFGADLGLRRAATQATTLTSSLGARLFESDDSGASQSLSLRFGFDHLATERIVLGGNLGASLTSGDGEDVTPGVVGGLTFSYAGERGSVEASLSQDVDQGSDGEVATVSALGVAVNRELTQRASLSLAGRATVRSSVFGGDAEDRQTLSLTPSFRYALTADWSTRLGYTFRASREEDEDILSNAVFLQLSYRFE
ncbi:hypothetical protein [Rubrimonas cliftonensis]|uniref:Beta-barrel porin 2 n=1 Tax=Rubrimonas cliftonensis TaxID=89524 RepID=A0A1H4CV24_9RHOB|nr:hypothetical protein [Rubrimonas cliftonensis]SEA64166.1 hypothetical protein SAMN05444370_10848 [Rubrimonas cliftonensis]